MIRITSKRDGFRRCGAVHNKAAAEYDDDHWSKEELAALRAEPMLSVEEVDPSLLTVAELTKALGEMLVKIPAGAKKADLLALYDQTVADADKDTGA